MSHVMLESVIRMPFEVAMGDHFSRVQFYQRAQQALNELEALQAKLAEQHTPIAWLNEETGDVISSELKDDAPEMLKGYDVPLYRCPDFSCQGLLDSSHAPFTPKNASEMRSFIGMNFDSLQYANPETEEPDEMDRYTLTIHDLLSAFDWAGHYDCDHIVDMRKMVGSDHIPDIGQMVTPLAQRKIQTLLDKGEYRVIENATVLVNERGHAAIVNRGGAFYWVDNRELAREFDGAGVAAETESREGDKQCKMVWCACGDGFEPDTFGAGFITARGHCQGCDAEDKSSVLAESKAKIMAAAGWLADVCVMEIRGTETDKDVAEAYKALEMRVAAELAIAQERANKELDGWQLVPIEPTAEMCDATDFEGEFRVSAFEQAEEFWSAMLAAAPKFGEDQ